MVGDFDIDPDDASVGDVVQLFLEFEKVPEGVSEVQFFVGTTELGAAAVVAQDLTVRATRSVPFSLAEGDYPMSMEAAGQVVDLDKDFEVKPVSVGGGIGGTFLMWLVNVVVILAVVAAVVAAFMWWRGDSLGMTFLVRRSSNRARARMKALKGFTVRDRE